MMDYEQLDRLFREHKTFVKDLARKVTRNQADADDIVQTIFLNFMGRESLENIEENPRGYLYRATLYQSFNFLKRREHDLGPDPEDEGPTLKTVDPATRWGAVHSDQILKEAMDQLKPEVRELLKLAYWDGYTDVEIAEMTGKSRSAISVALTRARDALRNTMCETQREPEAVRVKAARAS